MTHATNEDSEMTTCHRCGFEGHSNVRVVNSSCDEIFLCTRCCTQRSGFVSCASCGEVCIPLDDMYVEIYRGRRSLICSNCHTPSSVCYSCDNEDCTDEFVALTTEDEERIICANCLHTAQTVAASTTVLKCMICDETHSLHNMRVMTQAGRLVLVCRCCFNTHATDEDRELNCEINENVDVACYACGYVHAVSDMLVINTAVTERFICERCFRDRYENTNTAIVAHCAICDETHSLRNMTYINTLAAIRRRVVVCQRCFEDEEEEEVGTCWNCSATTNSDGIYMMTSEGEQVICNECFNTAYNSDPRTTSGIIAECRTCDAERHVHEMRIIVLAGVNVLVCQECYAERATQGDAERMSAIETMNCDDRYEHESDEEAVNTIHNYHYKPVPRFFYEKDEQKSKCKLYAGFELEVEALTSNYNADFESDTFSEHSEDLYLKHDTSLDNGFEIVSHPRTLKSHKNAKWDDMLKYLSAQGFKSHNADTCGLHVHVSRKSLSASDERKLAMLIYNNVKKVEIFARRRMSSYAKAKKLDKLSSDLDKIVYSTDRQEMLNFTNKNTIEFRMFRGTLKYETFIATIEFVDACVRFVKTVSIMQLRKEVDSFELLKKFVHENKKDYTYLTNYFKMRGL